MKKIDLTQLKVYRDMARTDFELVDIRLPFANNVYRNCPGIEYHALAHLLYEQEGGTELSDGDAQLLLEAARACTPAVYDAIAEQLRAQTD